MMGEAALCLYMKVSSLVALTPRIDVITVYVGGALAMVIHIIRNLFLIWDLIVG